MAAGTVWRVVPTNRSYLIGEARDTERKEASFFCIERSGNVLWENRSFGEQWWIGIEAVEGDVLLVHKYATPDMPEHRTIIAVDIPSADILWQNEALKFEMIREGRLFASRVFPEGRKCHEVGLRSGEIESESDAPSRQPSADQEAKGVPQLLEVSNSSLITRIRSHCGKEIIVGTVAYVELPSYLIFSFHAPRRDQSRATILTIIDKNSDTVLFSETVNSNTSAFVPESFFVENHMVYYVHERRTLTAVQLP